MTRGLEYSHDEFVEINVCRGGEHIGAIRPYAGGYRFESEPCPTIEAVRHCLESGTYGG